MLGETLALGSAVAWACSVILFKRSEAVSPQALNLFKNVWATALLLLTLPIIGAGIDWDRSSGDWWRLIVSGVLGIAIADTLVFVALRRLRAGLLAVVECVYAPSIVILSVLFLDEQVGLVFLVGAVCVVGGVLIATSESAEGEHIDLPGVAFGVLGIVAMAAGVILAKPVLERSGLVEVTTVRLIAGVVGQLLWLTVIPSGRHALAVFRPSPVWRTLIPASILSSYVAMLLWLGGYKWADASVAAVLNQMATVMTIVFARIFLNEVISPRKAAGATAAVAGALLILVW